MSSIMKKRYIDLKPKVKEVMKLAKEKEEYDSKGPNSFSLNGSSMEDAIRYHVNSEPSKNLDKALSNLSDDELMLMQTLMYIGRDEVNKFDETELDEIVLFHLKTLGFQLGKELEDRVLEINQMSGKGPLREYLKQGLEKIGV